MIPAGLYKMYLRKDAALLMQTLSELYNNESQLYEQLQHPAFHCWIQNRIGMRCQTLNRGKKKQHVGARARREALSSLLGRREGRPPRPQRGGGAEGPTVGRARARARALSTRNVTFSFMRPSNMQNLSAGAAHTADL